MMSRNYGTKLTSHPLCDTWSQISHPPTKMMSQAYNSPPLKKQ